MALQRLLSQLRDGPGGNDAMVDQLKHHVVAAFRAVDRGQFVDDEESKEAIYMDMPFRHGRLHLSAPSIYAAALEALELEEGHSVLNVGSGTGYMASLISHIAGRRAIHVGIELHQELVDHARQKLDGLGHTHVQLHCGSCFALDPEASMRFERIYVGAGASQRSAEVLFRMLHVGGIIVGPFSGPDGSQRLLKAQRISESHFQVKELLSVQFTPLISPMAALPPIALHAPTWTPEAHPTFPRRFGDAVRTVLMAHNRADNNLLSALPKELWVQAIFPMMGHDWFDPNAKARPPRGSPPAAKQAAARAVGVSEEDFEEEEEEGEEEEGEENGEEATADGEFAEVASEEEEEEEEEAEEEATPPPVQQTSRRSSQWGLLRQRSLSRILRLLGAGPA